MYWTDDRLWGPFAELHSLQQEMNRLFDGLDGATTMARFPALNIWGNSDNVVVTAELPGVALEDLDLNVVNRQLTLKGERKDDHPAEASVCQCNERGNGNFVRTVRLPFAVECDQVAAKYDKGVLTITLPRSESTKPKKIKIKTD